MCNLMEREPRQQIDYITTWNSITFPHVTMKRRFDANRNFSNQYFFSLIVLLSWLLFHIHPCLVKSEVSYPCSDPILRPGQSHL